MTDEAGARLFSWETEPGATSEAGEVCPACTTTVPAGADRCPACGTVITGMADGHADQTAADYGADQVDPTTSGPGDTDGGVPWAPGEND